MNERKNKWMDETLHELMKKYKWMLKWKNERKNESMNERKKIQMNECMTERKKMNKWFMHCKLGCTGLMIFS